MSPPVRVVRLTGPCISVKRPINYTPFDVVDGCCENTAHPGVVVLCARSMTSQHITTLKTPHFDTFTPPSWAIIGSLRRLTTMSANPLQDNCKIKKLSPLKLCLSKMSSLATLNLYCYNRLENRILIIVSLIARIIASSASPRGVVTFPDLGDQAVQVGCNEY